MSEDKDLLDLGVGNEGGISSKLPNANTVLTLGILSIVGCLLYILPGLICGIIALAMYPKVKRTYLQDPARFEISFKNAKGGFICAIIGTSLAALYLVFAIVFLGVFFSALSKF